MYNFVVSLASLPKKSEGDCWFEIKEDSTCCRTYEFAVYSTEYDDDKEYYRLFDENSLAVMKRLRERNLLKKEDINC